jgi:tryptophanyl-tRNA synthetase
VADVNMMKKRILTGDRPTGPLHLGHLVGSLKNRVRLQDDYECFFIIADYQILTDHIKETEQTENNITEILLDWLSVGMDPEKSTFFIQSRIPEIAELAMYFSMMVTLPRLQRNPTVKDEIKQSGMRHISYGFLGYPVSQAADILIVRAHLVPVGDDQLPHIEQTREIARTFNGLFKEVLPVPEALVGEVPRLPGLDGQKMGKSLGNAIYLKDAAPEIRRKIDSAITDPARIRANDVGHPEVCNIYQDQLAFNPEKTPEIEAACRKGEIGCVACKRMASEAVIAYLQPIQERRAYYQDKTSFLKDIVREGNDRTRVEAKTTMSIVRQAMHFDYKGLLCA